MLRPDGRWITPSADVVQFTAPPQAEQPEVEDPPAAEQPAAPQCQPEHEHRSEFDLGAGFVREHGADWRFRPGHGFLKWRDGAGWKPDSTKALLCALMQYGRNNYVGSGGCEAQPDPKTGGKAATARGAENVVTSVVVAIVFGLIVDDTIHFLTKYMNARGEGLAADEAVRSAFRTAGQALLTTTVVLSAGFTVFATSGFEVSWSLGLLVTMTILFALAADFLLLPTLLIAVDRSAP